MLRADVTEKLTAKDTDITGVLTTSGVIYEKGSALIPTDDNTRDLSGLKPGNYTYNINQQLNANQDIKLPEANASNVGMKIQIIFGDTAALVGLNIGFSGDTVLVGGATVVADSF